MALGGGTWSTQNKILPGTYINFVSAAKANATLSDRGIAAAPFVLSWGPEGTVFAVTAEDFEKNSRKIFGYDYTADEMLNLREIFKNASKVYCYRLGTGTAAENTYATAKYAGTRGNDLLIKIKNGVDSIFVMETYLDGNLVDSQTFSSPSELVANDYLTFKSFTMSGIVSGAALTGGANASEITGSDYQGFLDAIEPYSFNTLCCPVAEDETTTIALFVNYTKRLRDTLGIKFQLVAPYASTADNEGVIGVGSYVWRDASRTVLDPAKKKALLYWVTGAQAAVAINKSLTNAKYNGELNIKVDSTQSTLESQIEAGKFVFHKVNGEVRILKDINTLKTLSADKGEVFKSNQTIRVCDQIANDTAVLFNTQYLGAIPNDASGRVSLWNDVVKVLRELEQLRAVENFNPDDVTVEAGIAKGAVVLTINGLNIINAMSQLYMSVIVQ